MAGGVQQKRSGSAVSRVAELPSKPAMRSHYLQGSAPLPSSATASPAAIEGPNVNGFLRVLPSSVGNKHKRAELRGRERTEKLRQKKKLRDERQKQTALAEQHNDPTLLPPPVQQQRTQENTRIPDETVVDPNDISLQQEDDIDEFSNYFQHQSKPRIILTSNIPYLKQKSPTYQLLLELLHVFPNSYYYRRGRFEIKDVVQQAQKYHESSAKSEQTEGEQRPPARRYKRYVPVEKRPPPKYVEDLTDDVGEAADVTVESVSVEDDVTAAADGDITVKKEEQEHNNTTPGSSASESGIVNIIDDEDEASGSGEDEEEAGESGEVAPEGNEHGEQSTSTEPFTDILIFNENAKRINGLTHIHLPYGPTVFYSLRSLKLRKDLNPKLLALPTDYKPEVILNNFTSRVGHRIGRCFAALFHPKPEFRGRRVVTLHNQRDFIFFRQHRYIFGSNRDGSTRAQLQEIGPRFTLKLQWLQSGTFDTRHGEYEWIRKKDVDDSKKKFHI